MLRQLLFLHLVLHASAAVPGFPAAVCSEDVNRCFSNSSVSITNRAPTSCTSCTLHSFCFLGTCMCHPGYDPVSLCTKKLTRLNPWFSKGCLALRAANTFNASMTLRQIGGEFNRDGSLCPKYMKSCAYLCFSHVTYGVAAVPRSLWMQAQKAEASLWKEMDQWVAGPNANDRAVEHWGSFDSLACLPQGTSLGRTIEVGAGPWTQTKGFLHIRPDLRISDFTVLEPSANSYIAEVSSCSYKTGQSLGRWDGRGQHPFPVHVVSAGGEALSESLATQQFDTLVSINVLEHVQNAFEYLSQLYHALRPGGLLIFHDRYYVGSHIMDGDLYHPVRIKRKVLDHFLAGFRLIYNNCSATYDGRMGEMGYYVIGTKI